MNINPELKSLQEKHDLALKKDNQEEIIKTSSDLIVYHQKQGEFAQCIAYSKSLHSYYVLADKQKEFAHSHLFIGNCLLLMENYSEAEEHYNKALKLYQEIQLDLGEADVEVGFGMLYRHMGRFDDSLSHLIKALDIYDLNKKDLVTDKYQKQRLNWIEAVECCGVIYGQTHQIEKSLQFFERALALKKQYCPPASVCSTLMNMGVTFSESDTDRAMDYYLQALALMDNSTPLFRKAVLLNNLGGCLEDKGDYEKAIQYYQDALNMMESAGQIHYKAAMLKSLGTVYYKQGKYEEALTNIHQGLSLAQNSDSKQDMKECYLALSDIYSAKQDYLAALDYRVKYDGLKDEMFQEDLNTKLADMQKKYNETSLHLQTLKQEKSLITEELKKAMNMDFVGVSNSIKEVQRLASYASENKDTQVLITGESGVGKEIIARLIHYSDTKKLGRFIDVNCCSIPDGMAESEFFGYVRGAFTGAMNSKAGYLEEADKGTLFLDEIGDMPMILQSKLLRVLETKQIKRLGSNKSLSVKFRLVSATNKNISKLILDNRFRADFLYRINTMEINIPPLRERQDDIEPLLDYFLTEFAKRMNKVVPKYDKRFVNWLCDYSFPGNVRELRNMIERVMITLKSDKLHVDDFICQMANHNCVKTQYQVNAGSKLQEIETNVILKEVKSCGGNQAQAAKNLGIPYSTFKRKYKKLKEQ